MADIDQQCCCCRKAWLRGFAAWLAELKVAASRGETTVGKTEACLLEPPRLRQPQPQSLSSQRICNRTKVQNEVESLLDIIVLGPELPLNSEDSRRKLLENSQQPLLLGQCERLPQRQPPHSGSQTCAASSICWLHWT